MRSRLRDPDVVNRLRWLTLPVLCVSLMVISLDNTILNVALPTLAHAKANGGLGASEANLQWVVDSYTLVFAGLLLTAGSLGDRFGRYGALALGLTIFGVGSAASAFATSATMLIVFRSLMGVGGAFIMPSTLSILSNVFTNPIERGRAIGIWAGVMALGVGIGPVVGGFLLDHFWWGSVLLVNVPVVIVALIGGYFLVPSSKDPSAPKLDPFGAGLSIVGLGTLLWAIIEGPTKGWTSTPVLTAFFIGGVVLLGFVIWELTYDSPMLNIRFFKNPRFSAASGAITLTFMSMFGIIFLLTQYLQSVLGFTPLKAGALLLPMSIVMMMMAPLSARFVEFVGTKAIVASGLLFVAGSLLLMEFLNAHSSEWAVILVLLPFAVGMANVMAPATESIMGSLPREKAGVGSAINDTTRQVGGAIGVALMGSLLSSRYITHVNAGFAGSHAPPQILDIVRSNIQAAVAVGHGQGVPANALPAVRPFQSQILSVSKDAYVAGLHLALPVAAAIILVATIGVLAWLPARAAPEPQPELAMAGNGVGAAPSDGAVSVGSAVADGRTETPTHGNGQDAGSRPPAEEPVGGPAFDS